MRLRVHREPDYRLNRSGNSVDKGRTACRTHALPSQGAETCHSLLLRAVKGVSRKADLRSNNS